MASTLRRSPLALLLASLLASTACRGPAPAPAAPPPVVATLAPPLSGLESADFDEVERAAAALGSRLSPWQGALERGRAHGGHIALFTVARPTERPSREADARRVEAAAIAAHLRLGQAAPSNAQSRARARVLVLLAEVAEDAGVAYLRAELARTAGEDDAVPLMRALETVYGLPAFYEPRSVRCGEPGPPAETAAIFAKHRAAESKRLVDGRAALLAWLDTNAKASREQRANAALAAWDARNWIAQPDHSPEGIDFITVLRYGAVLRLGHDALPGLRARKAAAASNAVAGRYEALIAAITGQEDEALVRRLLADESDYRAVVSGIEAIAAAGSTRWTRELDAIQVSRVSEAAAMASKALASTLGADAVPLLRAAAAREPDNYTAKHVADELSERR